MIVAILLGICAGAVGFMPLLGGLLLTKRSRHAGVGSSMFLLVVGLLVSFAFLVGCAFICVSIDRPNALPFVLAEVIALSVAAISYGVWSIIRK